MCDPLAEGPLYSTPLKTIDVIVPLVLSTWNTRPAPVSTTYAVALSGEPKDACAGTGASRAKSHTSAAAKKWRWKGEGDRCISSLARGSRTAQTMMDVYRLMRREADRIVMREESVFRGAKR